MRRLLFPILLLVTPTAFSRHLTPKEAYNRCLTELRDTRRNATSLCHADDLKVRAVADTAGETRLYMFDTGNSFCIASADDAAIPVLAYGDYSLPATEDMPPAMTEWLGFYAREIAWASENNLSPTEERESPQRAAALSLPSIEKLITSTWNQSSPYNDKCPVYSGKLKCYTGCVATAVAQIMYRYKFPEHGIGMYTHSDEICGQQHTWTIDFGNTTYRWDQMTHQYTSKSSAAAKEAVATLMQHLGVAFKMDYDFKGLNQSGASLMNAAIGLIRNFGYSKGLRYESRSCYSGDEWKALLHTELSAGRPLLYEGNTPGYSGHAFICDGYDSKSDKFHFNWGWGGNGDGYYALSALKPATTSGIGGGNYNYTENQGAVFGIRTPQDNDNYYPLIRTYSDITAKKPIVSAGGTGSIIVVAPDHNGFYSHTPSEEVLSFVNGLELRNPDDTETYVLQSGSSDDYAYLFGKYTLDFNCDISEVPSGDYIGRPVVKICDPYGNPVGNWEYVRIPENALSTLEVHVGKRYISFHNAKTSAPMLSAEIVSFPKEMNYTDEFIIEADVTCRYADYTGNIGVAAYYDPSLPPRTLGEAVPLDIKAGATSRVRIPCRLNQKIPDSAELCLHAGNTPFCDGPAITVDNSEGVTRFIPDTSWPENVAPGEEFTLSGELCLESGAPVSGYAECRLLNADNKICGEASGKCYFSLSSEKNARMSFRFNGLQEEGIYWMELTYGSQSMRADVPLIVKEREFSFEAEYKDLITEDDIIVSLGTTLTLVSGNRYNGYMTYEITGTDGFCMEEPYGNYIYIYSNGESATSHFILWTDELPFGDYLINFYLMDKPTDETRMALGQPYPLRKVDSAGVNMPSTALTPAVGIDPDGRVTVRNIPADSSMLIYDSSGILLHSPDIRHSDTYVSDFTLLPGIYILKIGTQISRLLVP